MFYLTQDVSPYQAEGICIGLDKEEMEDGMGNGQCSITALVRNDSSTENLRREKLYKGNIHRTKFSISLFLKFLSKNSSVLLSSPQNRG